MKTNEKKLKDEVLQEVEEYIQVSPLEAMQFQMEEKKIALEKDIYNSTCLTQNCFHPEQRIITISGEINEEVFNTVSDALIILTALSDEPITIRLSSCGGEVWTTGGICGLLRSCGCQIITEVYGKCMSSCMLLLACGDIRRINKYAVLMDHSTTVVLGYSKIAEHRNSIEQEETELRRWNENMDIFTGKCIGTYAKLTSDKRFDIYLTPEEAVELGIADEVF